MAEDTGAEEARAKIMRDNEGALRKMVLEAEGQGLERSRAAALVIDPSDWIGKTIATLADVTGEQVTRAVRSAQRTRTTPVVMLIRTVDGVSSLLQALYPEAVAAFRANETPGTVRFLCVAKNGVTCGHLEVTSPTASKSA